MSRPITEAKPDEESHLFAKADGGSLLPELLGNGSRTGEEDLSCLNRKVTAVAKPVYTALAEHQRSEAEWEHRTLAAWLDEWWGRFADAFVLAIPRTPLRLEENLRRNCLGYFRPGYNEFGLKMEIALGVPPLADWGRLDRGDLLGTLLHEQLHLDQEIHGKPSKHNHHNSQFRDKAKRFGLVVDYRGHQFYAPRSAFLDLLLSHGVAPPLALTQQGGMTPHSLSAGKQADGRGCKSRLKKWSCACTPPGNARVAIADFQARCLKCGAVFKKVC